MVKQIPSSVVPFFVYIQLIPLHEFHPHPAEMLSVHVLNVGSQGIRHRHASLTPKDASPKTARPTFLGGKNCRASGQNPTDLRSASASCLYQVSLPTISNPSLQPTPKTPKKSGP